MSPHRLFDVLFEFLVEFSLGILIWKRVSVTDFQFRPEPAFVQRYRVGLAAKPPKSEFHPKMTSKLWLRILIFSKKYLTLSEKKNWTESLNIKKKILKFSFAWFLFFQAKVWFIEFSRRHCRLPAKPTIEKFEKIA